MPLMRASERASERPGQPKQTQQEETEERREKSEERRAKREERPPTCSFKAIQTVTATWPRRVDSALAKKMMLDTASCLDPTWIRSR
jgi:hypothetical protein